MSSDLPRQILVRIVPLGALVAVPFLIGMFLRWRAWRLAVVPEVEPLTEHTLDPELRRVVEALAADIERLGFRRIAILRSTSIAVWDDYKMSWQEVLYVNDSTLETFSACQTLEMKQIRFLTETADGPYVDTNQVVNAGLAPDLDTLYRRHQSCVAAELPTDVRRRVPSADGAVAWLRRHLTELTAVWSTTGWRAAAGSPWYRLTFRGAAAATWEGWWGLFRREQNPSSARGFDVLPLR